MPENSDDLSAGLDLTRPSPSRLRDYLLGGSYHFSADRRVAGALEARLPYVREMAWLNRAFLRRAVSLLLGRGVHQFVDVGFGIPAVGNVHEAAQRVNPSCRVVYVERDPVEVAQGELMLSRNARATVVHSDPCDPAAVLGNPGTTQMLDLAEPIGLLMAGSLHLVPDSRRPVEIVARYVEALAPDSYLVLSHATADRRPMDTEVVVETLRKEGITVYPKPYHEVVRFFAGTELVAPGVVTADEWYPEQPVDPAERLAGAQLYVGVGRKR
ncbi:hypothetical protein GCM10012275_01730 [Longimycelium tulufanense]|uniref:S-adenosyl methyltransferase n=1 Tax=Longimycelium tulufanense TaxID=907463 RepID=A0A8J3FSZ5_9PSEU|nr:hypothetical protein GCM10012275_01730 [Longimycelium tulufanense]